MSRDEEKMITDLRKETLFQSLKDVEFELLLQDIAVVKYSKGEHICKEGEFVTHAIFQVSGYVKIHTSTARNSVIFNISRPGDFAALPFVFSSEKHHLSLTSLDETLAVHVNIHYFRELVKQNGKFASELLKLVNTSLLHYLNHNLISLTQNNMHGKMANTLLYLSEKVYESTSFDMLLSRVELAQLSNISRENVIKLLYEFKNDKLIELRGRHIELVRPELLRKIAELG